MSYSGNRNKEKNQGAKKTYGKNYSGRNFEREKRTDGVKKNRSDYDEEKRNFENQRDDIVIGRNAVAEALKSGRPAEYILVEKGEHTGSVIPIIKKCKELGIPVKEADRKKLDFMCGQSSHQGVILVSSAKEYSTVDDILSSAKDKGEDPFIVILDKIEDPHNLGAIIRSAEAAGVHGIIIPERRSVGLNYTVGKSSAGALEYVPVARVANITSVIKELKKSGIWIYAADMDGEDYRKVDFSGPCAIVVGSEGSGISRLVKENCDKTVSIPMKGKINSLNASVAASVLMFEAARSR